MSRITEGYDAALEIKAFLKKHNIPQVRLAERRGVAPPRGVRPAQWPHPRPREHPQEAEAGRHRGIPQRAPWPEGGGP